MNNLIATSERYLVIGIGITGCSVVRYLLRKGCSVAAADTRDNPPGLKEFQQEFPELRLTLGTLNKAVLEKATCLVVSPGVAVSDPAIQAARAAYSTSFKICGPI